MLRLWLRIFVGVVILLVLQYLAGSFILGENDLDSYELAGFTISNGYVYHELVDQSDGMRDKESLIAVLESLHIPLLNLHVMDRLPYPAESATDIPLFDDPSFDWEELCKQHDILRLVLPERTDLPPAYLFFLGEQRPIVAFQTRDKQAWFGIDPVGDEQSPVDWSELIPFIIVNAVIAIALAWFVSGSLARRIGRLSRLSEAFAAGNLSQRSGDTGSDSIGVLGHNFNNMATSIERIIEDQRDLLRAVAHELRTPLARIGMAIGLVSVKHPVLEQQVLSIEEDLQELESLIAEITDYLRLEHGKTVQHERLNLSEIIQSLTNHEMRDIEQLNVTFSCPTEDVTLCCHRNSIQRCVSNIIKNASRFARSQIKVTLSQSHKSICIMVEDDGPGFPHHMLDQVTAAFVTTTDGRLGLGLALCRRIIELADGKLYLGASDELGGASVQITLPDH